LQRPDNRSQPFDAALKRELDSRLQPGGHDCPDDAAMAAYVDGSIGTPERARLDAHCSNCARCQHVLAAMARADLAGSNAGAGFGARWRLYGAIAAALAGASIAVTLGTRHVQMAELRVPKDLGAPISSAKRSQPTAVIALNQPASNAQMERESASETVESKSLAPQRLARPGQKLKSGMLSKEAPGQAAEPVRNELAAAAPAVAAPPKPAILSPARPVAGAPSAPMAASAPPRAEPPAPAADLSERREIPGTFVGGMAMQSSRSQAPAGPAGAPMISVRTADGVERWRLGPGGTILHRDPDGSWQTQATRVAASLNAAAAPSPEVCWVAGSNGTVLRTTDGAHWQKVGSPTSSDLVSVFAASASDATVTTADGKRFATSDGGQTWRPLM
jgi:hypothetical protein